MMEVSIILRGVLFGGIDSIPDARTAVVAFEIQSDDVGTIKFNVDVVPEDHDPAGVDGAIIIARRTLVEFGKALATAGERYEPPLIYSPKSESGAPD